MGRRAQSRSEPIDGLLLLNKPAGLTSNQALQRVKRLLNAQKAGHTGSLDPAATGMLPLCFGEATKVCAFLLDADKSYRVTAQLGISTDTGDADGSQTGTAEVPDLTTEQWRAVLESFLGDSLQIPPMYSALKKDGQRLYKLARRGETVEREPRPIRVDEIRLLEAAGTRLVFRVHCSKGTYIRVLVEDIAKKAGTLAHTARLHRETVGRFRASEMLDMSGIEAAAAADSESLKASLLPPDTALQGMQAVHMDAEAAGRFSGGQQIMVPESAAEGLVRVYGPENEFLGVGELANDGRLAPKRVFRTAEKNP